jgi:hypothetical protein
MLAAITKIILDNWIEWLMLGVFSAASLWHRKVIKAISDDRAKNKAVAKGLEALLRDRIIDCYNKYEKKGTCPIYAKENVERLYIPYHELGGNDVATELVEQLLGMPSN